MCVEMRVLFKYIICRNSKVCFLKKHLKNAGYPLRVLGYFDRFGNGKCYNSPPVNSIGLRMRTFYIRGYCGGGWMGLAPSKFAILRDRGIQKWVGEDFGEVWKKGVFWKLLGMGWPGVGNVPRPCGSIYCVSRGSQEPYRKKTKFSICYI